MCLLKRKSKPKPGASPSTRVVALESTPRIAISSSSQSSGQQSFFSRESTSSQEVSKSLPEVRNLLADGALVYKFKDIKRATDAFSSSRKVGDSRSVFRASLRGMDVAITQKKLEAAGPLDFLAELKLLCNVNHSSIVKLLGACVVEGDCVYVVHEFVEGSNLRLSLRSPHNPNFSLLPTWTSRLQVALDVAIGLEYLHDFAYPTYIHKFIKSRNILIDSDLRAKIAQFGVSTLTDNSSHGEGGQFSRSSDTNSLSIGEIQPDTAQNMRSESARNESGRRVRYRSIRISGTQGYMPPEYLSMGLVTTKYDVYAFGVVLLELLSGQEPVEIEPVEFDSGRTVYTKTSIVDAIGSILDDQDPRMKLRGWMDPLLGDTYPLDSAYKTALLARSCVDPNPVSRPVMRDVGLQLSKLLTAATVWEAKLAAAKNLMSGPIEAR